MTRAQHGLIAPELDPDGAPWWAAVAEGRFVLPRCRACGAASFPPAPTCPHCGAGGLELHPASGRGTVYSWVVVHRALDPAFAADVPYTVLAVDLDEGPRMFGRVCDEHDGPPVAGEAVDAVLYEVGGQRLVGFARRGAVTEGAR